MILRLFFTEIHHEWSNYALPTIDADHWGLASVGGQLGGFERGSLTSLGDNNYSAKGPANFAWCPYLSQSDRALIQANPLFNWFGLNANGGNSNPYAKLELFMMGLITDEEVPAVQVAQNAVLSTTSRGQFTATGFKEYSAADVRAAQKSAGLLQPNLANAQRDFKALVVVVTDQARLPDATVRKVSAQMTEFATPSNLNIASHPKCAARLGWTNYNFWMATGGRANLMLGGISASIRDPATPQLAN